MISFAKEVWKMVMSAITIALVILTLGTAIAWLKAVWHDGINLRVMEVLEKAAKGRRS